MKPDGPTPRRGARAGKRVSSSPAKVTPATPQNAAILKLLGDEDASMVQLVLQLLLADRAQARPRLEGLLRDASEPAARQLRQALKELRKREAMEALRIRCKRIEHRGDLEDFCWKAALCHDPEAPVVEARLRLDTWGEAVAEAIPPGAAEIEKLEALRQILAEEVGLRGNGEDYYAPANSFLDKVIFSRLGNPIALVAIYILVGERAGIEVEPIGMPGHFLARIGRRYLDPFHEGLSVDERTLRELLERGGIEQVASIEEALREPPSFRLMALRMIGNLVNIFDQAENKTERDRWQQVLGWLEEGS